MSDCPDCRMAAEQQHHGYHKDCPTCEARAMARAPWVKTEVYLQQFDPASREQMREAALNEWRRCRVRFG